MSCAEVSISRSSQLLLLFAVANEGCACIVGRVSYAQKLVTAGDVQRSGCNGWIGRMSSIFPTVFTDEQNLRPSKR